MSRLSPRLDQPRAIREENAFDSADRFPPRDTCRELGRDREKMRNEVQRETKRERKSMRTGGRRSAAAPLGRSYSDSFFLFVNHGKHLPTSRRVNEGNVVVVELFPRKFRNWAHCSSTGAPRLSGTSTKFPTNDSQFVDKNYRLDFTSETPPRRVHP